MAGTPPRLTARDFDPAVLRLFDRYVHGEIDRRAFLDRAAAHSARGVGALALLQALSPDFAGAQQVAPTDPRIRSETLAFSSARGSGHVGGLLVRPAQGAGPFPVVLAVHENRGLNPHIEDIARRLATAGFMAFAPDALRPLGGYPGDEDKARALFAQLDPRKTLEDLVAAARHLTEMPDSNGHLGAVGFCWGGGMVDLLATRLPDLRAAVAFYGAAPPLDQVANIKARMLLFFAGNDERINALWPPFEAALKAAGVGFEATVFPGVEHGFNNDTTPRYDAAAARQAWQRTLALFDRTLRG